MLKQILLILNALTVLILVSCGGAGSVPATSPSTDHVTTNLPKLTVKQRLNATTRDNKVILSKFCEVYTQTGSGLFALNRKLNKMYYKKNANALDDATIINDTMILCGDIAPTLDKSNPWQNMSISPDIKQINVEAFIDNYTDYIFVLDNRGGINVCDITSGTCGLLDGKYIDMLQLPKSTDVYLLTTPDVVDIGGSLRANFSVLGLNLSQLGIDNEIVFMEVPHVDNRGRTNHSLLDCYFTPSN